MLTMDDDISELLEGLDRGRQAWISGQLEWTATSVFEQSADMTIFGPFGGEATLGDPQRQAKIASQFEGGTGLNEIVKVIREGDLVVIVMIERNRVRFSGRSSEEPWVLRTTQIFRKDRPGHWLRLHRHADPLIVRKPLGEVLAMLQEKPSVA
jgi:ketosteroid isomerase-like protein